MKSYPLIPALLALAGLQVSADDYTTGLWFGTIRPPLAPPTGQVQDRIFVGDNFQGLVFADQNLLAQSTTPTLFYSIRSDAVSGVSYLDTIATPVAPHAAPPVVDRFSVGSFHYNALAFAAPDLSYEATLLYSLRDGSPAQLGTVNVTSGTHADQFQVGPQFDSLTFSATDVTFGANLIYYLRHDLNGTHFGTIDVHQPGTITDRWLLNLDNFDALVFTDTDVGYGANQFYYIRHDIITGQHSFGSLNPLNGVAVDHFTIGTVTDDFEELAFTTTDVGYGANLFYYLRATRIPAGTGNDTGPGGGVVGPFGNGESTVPESGGIWAVALSGSVLGVSQWWARRRRKAVGT